MPASVVGFRFRPGLHAPSFTNVRLCGSWTAEGRSSPQWSTTPIAAGVDPDGGQVLEAEIVFPDTEIGTTFRWGVRLDGPAGPDLWVSNGVEH